MFMCGSGSCVPWSSTPQRSSSIKARTQVCRLVSKHLYLLCQLTGPGFSFLSLPLIPLEQEEFPVRKCVCQEAPV